MALPEVAGETTDDHVRDEVGDTGEQDFPVIVAVSAQLEPIEAVDLVLTGEDRYEALVTDAHPGSAACSC
jgi:hypothetical protein